ncbi:MAG: TIM44-like domain-containing protein [Acidimicrobiia bacterium]
MRSITRLVFGIGIVVAVSLTQRTTALAAPGGGSGGFGGGGGGGGGGGSGGSGGFSGSGDGGGIGGVFFLGFFLLLFVGYGFLRATGRIPPMTVRGRRAKKSERAKREQEVAVAAEEARTSDEAFAPEVVKPSAVQLHKDIVAAWTARDRDALRQLIAPDLFTEWALRLDDFDAKGWHNITELRVDPKVEYLGLVNRADDTDDRVIVRIEAELSDYVVDRSGKRIYRTGEDDDLTVLAEYWVLGKGKDGDEAWTLLSIEQDAEGSHHVESAIIASPWADEDRLRDQAATERGSDMAAPENLIAGVADLHFEGTARTEALDLATMDGRFAPDVIEASVRATLAAWAEAVDGDDAALEAVTTPEVAADLLYPNDPTCQVRMVVRGPVVTSIRILDVIPRTRPAEMHIEAEITGRRYVEDRNTTTILEGSRDEERSFTERWTFALDGADETPWRLAGVTGRAPARH